MCVYIYIYTYMHTYIHMYSRVKEALHGRRLLVCRMCLESGSNQNPSGEVTANGFHLKHFELSEMEGFDT